MLQSFKKYNHDACLKKLEKTKQYLESTKNPKKREVDLKFSSKVSKPNDKPSKDISYVSIFTILWDNIKSIINKVKKLFGISSKDSDNKLNNPKITSHNLPNSLDSSSSNTKPFSCSPTTYLAPNSKSYKEKNGGGKSLR